MAVSAAAEEATACVCGWVEEGVKGERGKGGGSD